MSKNEVVQLPGGEWAIIKSTHDTKGAADKAVNDAARAPDRAYRISLTERQVQTIINALTKDSKHEH